MAKSKGVDRLPRLRRLLQCEGRRIGQDHLAGWEVGGDLGEPRWERHRPSGERGVAGQRRTDRHHGDGGHEEGAPCCEHANQHAPGGRPVMGRALHRETSGPERHLAVGPIDDDGQHDGRAQ